MDPVFTQGVYEGLTRFDDVYTRIVDAMVEADRMSYIADPRSTMMRCKRQADAALAILQSRAYAAIEEMDFVQANTDEEGGREIAWIWHREDLECHVLGLPGGPYVTEDDLDLNGDNNYNNWKTFRNRGGVCG